jgi:hypothetical protein
MGTAEMQLVLVRWEGQYRCCQTLCKSPQASLGSEVRKELGGTMKAGGGVILRRRKEIKREKWMVEKEADN